MFFFISRCELVIPISEASDDFSNKGSTDVCRKKIDQLIQQCKTVAKERVRDMKYIDKKRNDVIKSVKHVKYKMIESIEKMSAKLIDDLQKMYTVEKSEMKDHLSSLNEIIFKLEASEAIIGEARREKRDLSLFIQVQNLMDRHRKMTKVLEQIHDEAHKVVLQFKVNEKAESDLDNLRSIGEVLLLTKEYDVIPRSERVLELNTYAGRNMTPEEYNIRKPVSERSASYLEDINTREAEDLETSWITGIVVLQNSSLLIADNNNKRVKLIGSNQVISDSIQLSTPPFDIDLLNQEQAVFTMPDSKQIQFIRLVENSEIKIEEELDVEFDCHAIGVFKDKLIVTSIAEKSVKSLSLKGVVLWNVAFDGKNGRLFDWPWYVETNPDADQIYVSDRQMNTITTLGGNGDVKYVREVRGKGPRGLAMDNIGNLFVSYYMTDQLEIIRLDYTRDRRILLTKADGIKHPQNVGYDVGNGRLYVTSNNSDCVSIFQIS